MLPLQLVVDATLLRTIVLVVARVMTTTNADTVEIRRIVSVIIMLGGKAPVIMIVLLRHAQMTPAGPRAIPAEAVLGDLLIQPPRFVLHVFPPQVICPVGRLTLKHSDSILLSQILNVVATIRQSITALFHKIARVPVVILIVITCLFVQVISVMSVAIIELTAYITANATVQT